MTLSPKVLWAYKALSPLDHFTFSRASSGTYRDRNGVLQTATTDVPRTEWTDPDGDGNFERPSTLLERARTNTLTRSEEFDHANWVDTGTPVVTADDATAPDGATTADRIENDDGAAHEIKHQDVTVADDSTDHTASCFVKAGSAAVNALMLGFRGGTTTLDYIVHIDPTDGSVAEEPGVDSATNVGSEAEGDGWYRVWITAPNNSTGNTTARVFVQSARAATVGGNHDNSQTGDALWWGAQLENATHPSSYIATTTASVSRSIDNLEDTINFGLGDFTIYARYPRPIWADVSGDIGSFNQLIAISQSAPIVSLLFVDTSRAYIGRIEDADGNRSDSRPSIPAGDPLSVVAQYRHLTTDPEVRVDAGSGFTAWNSNSGNATAFTSFGDTVIDIGAGLEGGVEIIKVISGLVTLNEAANMPTPVGR